VTVEFYGKQFKIIGVDGFTRDFLKKTGVDVPENMSMPVDPYFTRREKVILIFYNIQTVIIITVCGDMIINFIFYS